MELHIVLLVFKALVGQCCMCIVKESPGSLPAGFSCSATRALGGMVMESAIPCFGSKTLGNWKEQRAEKRASHLAPVPAPTQVSYPCPGLSC